MNFLENEAAWDAVEHHVGRAVAEARAKGFQRKIEQHPCHGKDCLHGFIQGWTDIGVRYYGCGFCARTRYLIDPLTGIAKVPDHCPSCGHAHEYEPKDWEIREGARNAAMSPEDLENKMLWAAADHQIKQSKEMRYAV